MLNSDDRRNNSIDELMFYQAMAIQQSFLIWLFLLTITGGAAAQLCYNGNVNFLWEKGILIARKIDP